MTYRLLRSLAGLPHGTTIAIKDRATLGRAPDCDVQLVDPTVSRHHAKLEVDREGAMFIVDLASRTGTHVDGTRVERAPLHHGAVVSIAGFRLRYELSAEPVVERPARRVAGFSLLRVTSVVETVPPMRAPTPRPVLEAPPNARVHPDDLPDASPRVADASLISTIVGLRGASTPPDRASASLLHPEPAPGRRAYPRFACGLPGWLARADGDRIVTRPIEARDLAFGGAGIEWVDQQTQLAPRMWLVFDIDHEEAPMVVFPASLVWASPATRTAGLAFVGPPTTGVDAIELIRAQ